MAAQARARHRWRHYETAGGQKPIRRFLDRLSEEDAAEIAAAMADVRRNGLHAARHLNGRIYEVRADGRDATYRLLFAQVGNGGRILLALDAFSKKTQKTPARSIALATRRLRDWEERGRRGRG